MDDLPRDSVLIGEQPMKLRSLSLYDPFAVGFSEPFAFSVGMGKMLVNASLSSEIMKIVLSLITDYAGLARR